MIDFNKPIQTRDGRKVELLATNASDETIRTLGAAPCHNIWGPKRVVARVIDPNREPWIDTWGDDGNFMGGHDVTDLVNAPETTTEIRRFSYTANKGSGVHLSEDIYDTLEEAFRFTGQGWDGALEATLSNGRLLSVVYHAQ